MKQKPVKQFGEISLEAYAHAIGRSIPKRFSWFALGYVVGSMLTFAAIRFL